MLYRRRIAVYEALWAPAPVHRTCAVSKHAESARMITNRCQAVGIPRKLLHPDYLAGQSSEICGKFHHHSIRVSRISRPRLCTVNTGAKQHSYYAYLSNHIPTSPSFLLLQDFYTLVIPTFGTIRSAFALPTAFICSTMTTLSSHSNARSHGTVEVEVSHNVYANDAHLVVCWAAIFLSIVRYQGQ